MTRFEISPCVWGNYAFKDRYVAQITFEILGFRDRWRQKL